MLSSKTKGSLVVVLTLLVAAGSLAAQTKAPVKKAAATSTSKPFSIPARACGNKNAPIEVDIYTDFECPHCAAYYHDAVIPMMKDYCATNKIYFVHKEFPFTQHLHSRDASRWVLAAATVGKSEQLTEQFFRTQANWVPTGNLEAVAASVLGAADLAKVKQVMADHKEAIDAEIDRDVAMGHQVLLTETPTTIIKRNGQPTSQTAGGIPYARLKMALDSLIK